jgi:Nuclease-related domain
MTGVVRFSYAARSGAGGYAQERYAEGLASWRRGMRRKVLPFLAPLFAAGVALALVAPDPLEWFAGFWAGASAAVYMLLRESPPQFVEKWRRGAEGERATARVLGPLRRDGWNLFHDLDTGRGNRDHVIVSTAGVYLLDSKNLSGTVTVDGDAIRVHYRDYPRDDYSLNNVGSWMRGEAAELKNEIQTVTGERVWVQAIVVIWGKFDEQAPHGDRVIFIRGDALAAWLRHQPHRLSAATAATIAAWLKSPTDTHAAG